MNTPTQPPKTQHTALPWTLENHGTNEPEYGHGIVSSFGGAHRFVKIEGVGILETVDMDIPKLEANARLILEACNNYAALQSRVEELEKALVKHGIHQMDCAIQDSEHAPCDCGLEAVRSKKASGFARCHGA